MENNKGLNETDKCIWKNKEYPQAVNQEYWPYLTTCSDLNNVVKYI